jgi:hypothetical protein
MESLLARIYKPLGLVLAVIFAAVGALFLLIPVGVVEFFNRLSIPLGFQPSPASLPDFFQILALAYMAVVTFLAWSMFRRPREASFPRVLAVAKVSSSLFSFLLFFARAPYLMYLTNAVVDGFIGIVVILCSSAVRSAAAMGPDAAVHRSSAPR